jgi:mono/diheme cytochrome c family protein
MHTRPGTWLAIGLLLLLNGCATHRTDRHAVAKLGGLEIYQRLCASCHGPDAQGDGPVAALMKVRVPDLTLLAKLDGGEFPAEDIRRAIDGRWDRRAHGARDMPVWGWQLYDISSKNDAQERQEVDSMIDRLVEYLRSVQQ